MLVTIRHEGGGQMQGYAERLDGTSIDVVFTGGTAGMAMARTRFCLTHGYGEKKARDWRIVNLDELREWALVEHKVFIRPMPRSTGRRCAPRKSKPAHPRQLDMFGVPEKL